MMTAETGEYKKADQMIVGSVHRLLHGPRQAKPLPRLERDLANSYYWSGNPCKDYLFFVANWHPLFGTCFCHPAHPWRKGQRVIMLMVTIAFTALPTARLMLALDAADDE